MSFDFHLMAADESSVRASGSSWALCPERIIALPSPSMAFPFDILCAANRPGNVSATIGSNADTFPLLNQHTSLLAQVRLRVENKDEPIVFRLGQEEWVITFRNQIGGRHIISVISDLLLRISATTQQENRRADCNSESQKCSGSSAHTEAMPITGNDRNGSHAVCPQTVSKIQDILVVDGSAAWKVDFTPDQPDLR